MLMYHFNSDVSMHAASMFQFAKTRAHPVTSRVRPCLSDMWPMPGGRSSPLVRATSVGKFAYVTPHIAL